MEPINLDTLSAKELKVIAKDKGLEFAKNASAKEMLELLKNTDTPKVDETTENKSKEEEDTSGS